MAFDVTVLKVYSGLAGLDLVSLPLLPQNSLTATFSTPRTQGSCPVGVIFPCESTALRDFSTFQRNPEAGLTLPFLSSPTLRTTPT